jgi:hypothetical protein
LRGNLIWINHRNTGSLHDTQMFHSSSRAWKTGVAGIVAALISLYSFTAAAQPAPAPGVAPLTAQQVERLVAPIALYPDPLVARPSWVRSSTKS